MRARRTVIATALPKRRRIAGPKAEHQELALPSFEDE